MVREISLRSADMEAELAQMGETADRADAAMMQEMYDAMREQEKLTELALIACARAGVAEDYVRQLCRVSGIAFERIKP